MIYNLDDERHYALYLIRGLVSIDQNRLVMIGIVQTNVNLDTLLKQLNIFKDVLLQQIVVGRFVSAFLRHQHENMLNYC